MTWHIDAQGSDAYDEAYEARAADGHDVHGEASFVQRFSPRSVLDAGCGTGRIARELAHRGIDVVGVDRDSAMLNTAQRKAPHLDWREEDLATVTIDRTFEAVLLAGNVMIFLTPGTESSVLTNMAHHLAPGGVLITGFQLHTRLTADAYDALATTAGLQLVERWSTWDCKEWTPDAEYMVAVHKLLPT